MTDLDALVEEFAAALEAGESPDPREWIARVDREERQELASLIDSYLMTAPRRAWDPAAFEGSAAKQAVDRFYESIEGVSGAWPELLPQLRNRARIRRRELVERLAGALGVGGGDAELAKVGGYYNRMEHGLLPAEGVSDRVIEALAGIVGAGAGAIRAAGRAQAPGSPEGAAAFARLAFKDERFTAGSPAEPADEALRELADEAPPADESDDALLEPADAAPRADAAGEGPPASPGMAPARDEIDELFTGG